MKPIRFLNIDLDFFLNEIPYAVDARGRLPSEWCEPWGKKDIRYFLERQCHLKIENPITGRFVSHHDAAFDYWAELLKLSPERTIDLTHIDAHADLGTGDSSWQYIMGEHLHLPVEKRTSPPRGGCKGLNPGNYIAYAASCRWLTSIVYVYPEIGGNDLSGVHFEDYDKGKNIQLKGYTLSGIEQAKHLYVSRLKEIPPLFVEPVIQFSMLPRSQYWAAEPFDFVLVCQSPNYTPRESDEPISVFTNYINFK